MTDEQFSKLVGRLEASEDPKATLDGRLAAITIRHELGMLLLCTAHGKPTSPAASRSLVRILLLTRGLIAGLIIRRVHRVCNFLDVSGF